MQRVTSTCQMFLSSFNVVLGLLADSLISLHLSSFLSLVLSSIKKWYPVLGNVTLLAHFLHVLSSRSFIQLLIILMIWYFTVQVMFWKFWSIPFHLIHISHTCFARCSIMALLYEINKIQLSFFFKSLECFLLEWEETLVQLVFIFTH